MIKKIFNKVQEEHPYLSTLMAFNTTMLRKKFDPYDIRKQFNKLVDKDDYLGKRKDGVINYCLELNKNTDQ